MKRKIQQKWKIQWIKLQKYNANSFQIHHHHKLKSDHHASLLSGYHHQNYHSDSTHHPSATQYSSYTHPYSSEGKLYFFTNFLAFQIYIIIYKTVFWMISKRFYCFIGYGISSSYSSSLTSSGVRDASSLSGLNSSNGTIGRDVIAPSDAVTSLSSQKGKYSKWVLV